MDVTLLTAARVGELQDSGAWTSQGLVARSRARIADGDGTCNAIAFLNPDADGQAERLDRERGEGSVRGPLHGVPILVKDNIATGDAMMTTAGSLALDGVRAPADAHVVRRLRDAGLVLLGKTNLSEWANFRSSRSVTGWSSRGGQVRNAPFRDRSPGGSSSGSGTAVARGFTALAIGTETDGSVVVPAAMNGIVGIKPTVGLVSRTGVIPISASQDTAGPMARTVEDAALLLGAISGSDPDDPATERADDHAGDFTRFLDADALRGARIGVVRSYCGWHEAVDAVFATALAQMADAGASIVEDVELPARLPPGPVRHVGGPQDEHRTGELAPAVGVVVGEVELDRPVVGAGRRDRLVIAEATLVLRVGFRGEGARGGAPAAHQVCTHLDDLDERLVYGFPANTYLVYPGTNLLQPLTNLLILPHNSTLYCLWRLLHTQ